MKVIWGDILCSAFSLMTNQSANSLSEFIDIILFFLCCQSTWMSSVCNQKETCTLPRTNCRETASPSLHKALNQTWWSSVLDLIASGAKKA